MRASHILLEHRMKWPPSMQNHSRTEEQALELAAEITKKLLAGAAFEDMARQYSACPSRQKGGDLGRFSFDQMSRAFSEAAYDLKVGQISYPVKTEHGVHIIWRTE